MKPLLAHTFEDHRWIGGPVWVQPKFNGVRALYQNGKFQSRDEIPWEPSVLAHLSEPLKEMFDERVILDGELYVHGWSLQDINSAISVVRKEPIPKTLEVCYYVFDQVDFHRPFHIRFKDVNDVILAHEHPKIKDVMTVYSTDRQEVDTIYAEVVSNGFEGIMYRIGLCPYTTPKQPRASGGFLSDKNNRVWHLLKRKSWMDDEFECIGVEVGEGKRAGMTGNLILKTDKGITFGAGSGLTESQCIDYWVNPPIGRKFKIKFLCYTDGGKPFNPTIEMII